MLLRLRKAKRLGPIHPSAGEEVFYRKRLYKLVDAMHASVVHWIEAAYKANPPEIAADELPAEAMKRVLKRLSRQWEKDFDEASGKLANYFARSASKRSTRVLQKMLRDAGITTEFTMTRPMRDALNATIGEQVSLIKSIPQRYFTEVEGAVMRSVSAGRDLKSLSDYLQKQHGVTKRRAAIIARDQNNKATATLTRARQLELGIEEATWLHSGGGKEPRPSHIKMSGKKYDVKKGMYDPSEKRFIFPGELINCRCVSQPIIPGLS